MIYWDNIMGTLLLISLIFLGAGLFVYFRRLKYEKSGVQVEGTVIDMVFGNRGRSRYPVVNFTTINHQEIEKRYNTGSYPASYKKGDRVQIFYLEINPCDFIIVGKRTKLFEKIAISVGAVGTILSVILYL